MQTHARFLSPAISAGAVRRAAMGGVPGRFWLRLCHALALLAPVVAVGAMLGLSVPASADPAAKPAGAKASTVSPAAEAAKPAAKAEGGKAADGKTTDSKADAAKPDAPVAATPVEPAPASGPAMAMAARIAGDAQRTRLIIDLSRTAEFRAFTLGNPHRVIIDLTDVTFAFKAEGADMKRGLVSAYRFGVFAPGKARMVLDASDPVLIDKAFVLAAQDDQPARLVVELVKTDAATFARSLTEAAPQAPAVAEAATPAASPDDKRPVIVIDPGHGGVDSGTTGASAYSEKNIVLDVGIALKDKLEKTGRFRVVMTRSTDVFVSLGERVRIARKHQAALFVSIHADALAAGDGQARGASVYTLSDTASDADAAHLAEKENKSDAIAGMDSPEENAQVADILFDLAQRETKSFSVLFARTLVGSMKSAAKMHRTPMRSAGFRVLKAHDVPSVLVELGYMSSPQDLKQMTSDAWRDKMTDAMQGAIDDFFAPRVAGGMPKDGKGDADVTGAVPK
ncbi:N-acetylmuramoyl-L-alanine amidase [Xanthobacteraceae bacterium A53D]